jgi:hypothetical protein
MRRVAHDDQAVFIVLQAFAWEQLRDAAERDATKIRYPTYAESRFMAYHAILHGVNGLMYWGLAYVPPEHAFLDELRRVLHELRDHSDMILGRSLLHRPTLRYHERGSTITGGIEVLAKQTRDKVYLIAANTSIDPAAADFSALPPELADAKQLNVVGENRTVPIANGAFFDEFKGLDVHVYATQRR